VSKGIDAARLAGARVINLSLENASVSQTLTDAIDRATASGIIVVIAAGNEGAADPTALAAIAQAAVSRNHVIVAGSVNDTDIISTSSNRAGSSIAHYLAAVGEQVRAPDQNGAAYLWSGTSFAAPQISGAVALLAQAFPNLTGAQIVDLLLRTARDAGAAGADTTYGQGVLDLTRAFQPFGSMSMAGTRTAVPFVATSSLSAPMGDARQGTIGAVVLDAYRRAYTMDVVASLARPAPAPVLASLAAPTSRQMGFGTESTTVALNVTDRRVTQLVESGRAASVRPQRVAAIIEHRAGQLSVAIGIAQGAPTLTTHLTRRATSGFLLGELGSDLGFAARATGSIGVARQVSGFDLTAAAESGNVPPMHSTMTTRDRPQRSPYRRVQVTADRGMGVLTAGLSATWMAESATLLGGRLGAELGAPGARTILIGGTARLVLGEQWSLGGSWRQGWTRADLTGSVGGSGSLRVSGFAADVAKQELFGTDSIGLRVAQPMRVAAGGLNLVLPTGWDYRTDRVTAWSTQYLNLAPDGRELDVEARYARRLPWGMLAADLFWRRNPGHVAAGADDVGVAIRWQTGF
jgi:hypothetical protein